MKIHNVKFARWQIHGMYEKGKMKLFSNYGKIKIIVDVLYVLGLNKKLLSVGTIANKGNIMVLNFGNCLVIQNKDPNIIMAKGVKDVPKNGL
jgi:hypothetical protein